MPSIHFSGKIESFKFRENQLILKINSTPYIKGGIEYRFDVDITEGAEEALKEGLLAFGYYENPREFNLSVFEKKKGLKARARRFFLKPELESLEKYDLESIGYQKVLTVDR